MTASFSNVTTPHIPLFAEHPHVLHRLAPHLREQQVARGLSVLHHGDAASQLYFVQQGWVKLVRHTPDGKESIVGLCTHGDVFGEAALFPFAQYPYHAEVLHDVSLLSVPAELVRKLLADDPDLAQTVMGLLNERIAQTQLKLEHMSTLSTAQRLGCFLLRLCKHNGKNNQSLEIPVEKNVLAGYLGMKPETLSRSQQQLKTVGIEVHGAQVHVNSVDALRQFVCGSCSESGNCETEEV